MANIFAFGDVASGQRQRCPTDDHIGDNNDGDDMVVNDPSDDVDYLPKHILYTLQLLGRDGLREMGAATLVITKATKLISHVRHPCLASNLLEGERKPLTQYEDADKSQHATVLEPRFKLDWCSDSEKK